MESGLILDLYDDRDGRYVKELFTGVDASMPEEIKTASYLTPDEREALPDDAYALVINEGEAKFRKFACVDPGNTALSVCYLMKNGHKLHPEATKVAAHNLVLACQDFGIEVPEQLTKMAGIMGDIKSGIGNFATNKAIGAVTALPAALGAGKAVKQRLGEVAANPYGQIMTPGQFKTAEANGGTTMPSSKDKETEVDKATVNKTGSAGPGRLRINEGANPNKNKAQKDWDYQSTKGPGFEPHHGATRIPSIDLNSDGVAPEVHVKKASRYALRDRYPLDNALQIKAAAAYFENNANLFTPEDRREYCQNLNARASEVGYTVPYSVQKYASKNYAPEHEVKFAMDLRRRYLGDESIYVDALGELETKIGSIHPDMFSHMLKTFDKVAGISEHYHNGIPDPYWSTYGLEKKATFLETIGCDSVNEDQLRLLAKSPLSLRGLGGTFGDDFVEEFRKDPVSIFKSMPSDQKVIIMRAANAVTSQGLQ